MNAAPTPGSSGQRRIAPSKRAPLPSSAFAAQHPSSGGLLAELQAKHQSIATRIPIFKYVASFFINRTIREEYIETIKQDFFSKASKEFQFAEASSIFNTHFLPFLSECKLEDLPLFESLLIDPKGVDFVMTHLTAEPKPYLRNAFATLPLVTRLIGRLRPEDQRTYLKVWIQNANDLTTKDFKNFLGQYTAHLIYAESLQNRRPEVFDQDSTERQKLIEGYNKLLHSEFAKQAQDLAPFESVLRDVTVIENRQILMAGIASIYLGATYKEDSLIPNLVQRSQGVGGAPPFSLLNQIGITSSLPAGPPETLMENFQPFTEVYVTDPFSMETRRVRLPLPIQGRMTIGEARKQLEILKEVVNDPQRFDKACEKVGIVEGKGALRQPFVEFSEQVGVALGQALGDFNSTPTRPKGTMANTQPENAAVIAHPQSQGYAIESAKKHNLFRLQDGTLSLIPSGPGEKHRGIGTLSPTELSQATAVLLGKKTEGVQIDMPAAATDDTRLTSAQLFLNIAEETIEGKPFLVAETTISLDGKTSKRTTYYEVQRIQGKLESGQDVKTRIISSGLWERDLLLAKATFLEEHLIRNLQLEAQKHNPEGAQWVINHIPRVNFLMDRRFTEADRERYLNSMLGIVLDMSPEDFKKLSESLDTFLKRATEIQAERPEVYSAITQIDFVELVFADPVVVQAMMWYPFLAQIYKEEICEMTVCMNTQKLHENVAMHFTDPQSNGRMSSDLSPLHTRSTALSVEKHVPFQLLKDSEQIIYFHSGINLYVTNEQTMETRYLYFPFPFQGEMTITHARALLHLLDWTIASPQRFDENYKKLKLDPNLQEGLKNQFLTWCNTLELEYAKTLFDFNPTPTRPTMTFALETNASRAALQKPQDVQAARQVAMAKNIYLVEGKRSLLPNSIAQHHPQIATIAPQELAEAAQLLLGTKKEPVAITIATEITAGIAFKIEPKQFDYARAFQLETTLQGTHRTHTRTTLYMLKPDQKPEEKLTEIVNSGLFERDLLLAKAEFIGMHA